ncbi:hypothetical protein [Acinetobacter pseudolwoffii]|uniref:hypothetical protein n=1 Tax=Acinetobacter pseudolwoffii TaxID=2053287 RepID=UPI00094405B6|nr:hypothetical protein [Acinetobacter pseudolwoffii]
MQEQDKKQQQHEQLDQLKQQKQQQQPQHGPIDSPKNNQYEQDERVLNKQHRDDLQNQNIHGGHRE